MPGEAPETYPQAITYEQLDKHPRQSYDSDRDDKERWQEGVDELMRHFKGQP